MAKRESTQTMADPAGIDPPPGGSRLLALLRLARARFLITCLLLYVMGATWAVLLGAGFSGARLLFGYLIVLAAQLSVSYSNDYFDVGVDLHATPTLVSGGSGILISRPELREPAKWIAVALIVLSVALGTAFAFAYAYPSWFVGGVAFGALLGWFYSAPPPRLAYRGLGEISTALAGGFLVPAMGYLSMTPYLTRGGLLLTVPAVMYGLAFIIAVEIPDETADRLGHKATWVVRKGQRTGFAAICALLLLATGFYFLCARAWQASLPVDFRVLGLLSILPVAFGAHAVVRPPCDWQTATRLVTRIISAMTAFYVLMDAYLVFWAMG
jgi:1,4-dihydroxy-2-naphthoate polyprenyltransferase